MILEDLDVHYTMPIQPVLLPHSAVASNMLQGRTNQGAGYFNRSLSSSQLHVPSSHL